MTDTDTPEQQRAAALYFEDELPALVTAIRGLGPKKRADLSLFAILVLIMDLDPAARQDVLHKLIEAAYPQGRRQ